MDKTSFQLYCVLLTLPYNCAIHFEYQCRHRLGVQDEDVPFGGTLPEALSCMVLSLLRLVVFFVKFRMLVRCGLLLRGLRLFCLLIHTVWMDAVG